MSTFAVSPRYRATPRNRQPLIPLRSHILRSGNAVAATLSHGYRGWIVRPRRNWWECTDEPGSRGKIVVTRIAVTILKSAKPSKFGTAWLRDQVVLDGDGFVLTGADSC